MLFALVPHVPMSKLNMGLPGDTRIAVVCGGPSAEAEVSRVSGRGVAEALGRTYANVTILELDTNVDKVLRDGGVDIVDAGLPVARDSIVRRQAETSSVAKHVWGTIGSQLVVKPSRQGSALGVRFPKDVSELEAALEEAFLFDEKVLIEERIEGREITVGILERNVIEALPVLEVRTPAGSWYDFEHRYTQGLSEHVIPAPLPAAQYERTQELARLAHTVLGCRDLSRVDFVVPQDAEPVILEVNTLPGMTPTSLYPDAARADGLSFEALVAFLIERAWSRRNPARH